MMLSVPSVTMNGGICSRVTSAPFRKPQATPHSKPERKGDDSGNAVDDGEPAHHHRRDHHDHADREIDAGGQDDQRLRDAENADDRHLRQHGRQIAGGDEMREVDRSCPSSRPSTSTTNGTVVG